MEFEPDSDMDRFGLEMKAKYIAFDCTNYEFELCETEEEAKRWIGNIDGSEGYSNEQCCGMAGIAKIEAITKYTVIDRREDYTDDDGDNPWSYNPDFDTVGELILVELQHNGVSA